MRRRLLFDDGPCTLKWYLSFRRRDKNFLRWRTPVNRSVGRAATLAGAAVLPTLGFAGARPQSVSARFFVLFFVLGAPFVPALLLGVAATRSGRVPPLAGETAE